jgi:hypothetical protein
VTVFLFNFTWTDYRRGAEQVRGKGWKPTASEAGFATKRGSSPIISIKINWHYLRICLIILYIQMLF